MFDVAEDDWGWRQFLVDNPVSDELGRVLDKTIANATKRRYQSVDEVLTDLNQANVKTLPSNVSTLPKSAAKNIVISTPNPVKPSPQKLPLQTFEFEVVILDARGKIIDKSRRRAEYLTENLGGRIILEMVKIRGGTFMMGSPDNEEGKNDDESPQHRVTVGPFFMGKYPITQEQYEIVMGNNPSHWKGKKQPVEQVFWHDANEFCQKLSQITGKTYRLPSEAEWEYACRAGTTTPFHFGETITTDVANYYGNDTYGSAPKGVFREQTTDVGSFPPNAFGLYDLHGNVCEWCADPGHANYNDAPSDGSVWGSGGHNELWMLRGGSGGHSPRYCRSATRLIHEPDKRRRSFGFRVLCSSAQTH